MTEKAYKYRFYPTSEQERLLVRGRGMSGWRNLRLFEVI